MKQIYPQPRQLIQDLKLKQKIEEEREKVLKTKKRQRAVREKTIKA